MKRAVYILLALAYCGCAEATEDLPFYRTADLTPEWLSPEEGSSAPVVADFAFQDQDGQTVSRRVLEGKVYVANFFFVRCTAICPTMKTNMSRVQEAYASDSDVRMISHTVDPGSDTVPILRGYASLNKVQSGKWHLVTGSREDIYSLARDSYFADLDDLGEGFLHTENFYLVDADGHLRGVYNGTLELDVQRLIEDISVLRG
ncbi:MAG: protein SCO1/2 [Rhodothermales bacterium]|jgi:protein SCO1/2